MNTNNVVSLPAAVDLTGKEHHLVKLTATGVDLAAAADVIIGTLQRAMPKQEDGVYLGKSVAVFRRYAGIHYAVIGAFTGAIAQGATLVVDGANPGRLIPGATSPVAIAADTCTGSNGAIVNVIFI